jgi:(p)ppGpp synthase/HD superfamily hydrolase
MTDRIEKAKEYFRKAHDSIGQKRKYTGEPYWVHTEKVAQMVWDATNNEDLTIAALGHDDLEDVADKNSDYNEDAMRREFGDVVTNLVLEVTNVYTKENYPNLNRAERKRLEHKRLSQISKEAKSIKLADIADNVEGIVDNDVGFGKVFVFEKSQLLVYLRDGNEMLYKKATKVVADEIAKLSKL